jgi:hypothetical protein
MTKEEAAKIIDTIRESVEKGPDQFHLTVEVNVKGFQAIAQGGGVGAQITAVGGGPGSQTTGLSNTVSMDDAQVRIAQQKGDKVKRQQLLALVDSLNKMAAELRQAAPDQAKLTGLYDSLKNTWVPGVITSVVGNLITLAMMSARQ